MSKASRAVGDSSTPPLTSLRPLSAAASPLRQRPEIGTPSSSARPSASTAEGVASTEMEEAVSRRPSTRLSETTPLRVPVSEKSMSPGFSPGAKGIENRVSSSARASARSGPLSPWNRLKGGRVSSDRKAVNELSVARSNCPMPGLRLMSSTTSVEPERSIGPPWSDRTRPASTAMDSRSSCTER